MSGPIPLEEAWERLFALIDPLESETIPAADADGRFLAEPVAARRTQPWTDLSAMDGFAVAGEGPWQLVGESRAGAPFEGTVPCGSAIRISTGAAMPIGTDAVLLIEDAELAGDTVRALHSPDPRHIRRKGFDFARGDQLLKKGEQCSPAALALARTAGIGALTVIRPPRVVIIEGGDELVGNPAHAREDQLPAGNGAMLAAMARKAGAAARVIGPVPDRLEALGDALEAARDADCVITIGGASVGPHDLVRPAMEAVGATLDFWRVAIRPGKPLIVARREAQLILGLPGNPASAFVTGFLFALPAIRAMQGARDPAPRPIALPLDGSLPAGGPRREFRRATFSDAGVVPLEERDSSALRSLALARLLIDRPAHCAETKRGTAVPCYWLENGAIA